MKMELMYQRPKADYTVTLSGHASLCLGPTTKRETFHSSWKWVLLLLPGGVSDVLCFLFFDAVGHLGTVQQGVMSPSSLGTSLCCFGSDAHAGVSYDCDKDAGRREQCEF